MRGAIGALRPRTVHPRDRIAAATGYMGAALARLFPSLRLGTLWLATWLLVAQSILPTHVLGTAADPLAGVLAATLCHSEPADAQDSGHSGGAPAHAVPQCIFCLPGINLVGHQPVALQLPSSAWHVISVPQWAVPTISFRPFERPAVRGPPTTV